MGRVVFAESQAIDSGLCKKHNVSVMGRRSGVRRIRPDRGTILRGGIRDAVSRALENFKSHEDTSCEEAESGR
jgi:hypothetical protein